MSYYHCIHRPNVWNWTLFNTIKNNYLLMKITALTMIQEIKYWLLMSDNVKNDCPLFASHCPRVLSYHIITSVLMWLKDSSEDAYNRSKGLTAQSPGRRVFDFFGGVYCFTVYCVLSPAPHNIFHISMSRYSPFVLKVPLNTNQPTNLSPQEWTTG